MGKYSTKKENDDGSIVWVANDGREFGTRAGAWKHSKNLEEPEPTPTVETKTESETESETSPQTEADDSWATFDISDMLGEDGASEVIPSALKKIQPAGSQDRKKSKAQLKAERATNVALLKIGYRTGDHVLTRYRRVMLEDPTAHPITHTEEDYTWISGVSNTALEESGINLGSAIGPTQVALVANAYWFGSPIARIHAESEKSPFKGEAGSRVRRFLERIPFIGRRLKKKANSTPIPDYLKEGSDAEPQ